MSIPQNGSSALNTYATPSYRDDFWYASQAVANEVQVSEFEAPAFQPNFGWIGTFVHLPTLTS